MRGRTRAFTKKEQLDDRPFNCPVNKGNKQTKLKKLWVGEQVVESDEGWCSGGTIHETIHGTIRSSDLFPRDNSRVSEASLSSGLGEEEGVAVSQKKDVKHVTSTKNGFEPLVKLETSEGIRTPLNNWENSDKATNGGSEDQKILEEHRAESPLSPLPSNSCTLSLSSPPKSNSLRCSLSPPPPNPNSPGEVSTYISYYLRRNLAQGEKSIFLLQKYFSFVGAFLL